MNDPPKADADAKAREEAARAYAKASVNANVNADADANADANADGVVDEPTLFERAKAAPITFALAVVNVAVFLWVEQHGGSAHDATLLRFGAVEPVHVWAGEYWRLATYMFLHGGWLHILMNTYFSVGWSAAMERGLGRTRFVVLYVVSGVGAGCASTAAAMVWSSHVSVGASGALLGIIGATLALRRRQLGSFSAFFADRGVRFTLLQLGILTLVGLQLLPIDNAAHFGGLVVGFAIAWIYSSPPIARRNLALALGGAFAVLFAMAARPWWTPKGEDANRLNVYAKGYFLDRQNAPRGERLAAKGCKSGVASSCAVLAGHLESTEGITPRVDALRKRTCELDPESCSQIH